MITMGLTETLMDKLASKVAFNMSVLGGGMSTLDAIVKGKDELGIKRLLTPQERTELAEKLIVYYPNKDDFPTLIEIADTMPGYSSGGYVPDIKDEDIPKRANYLVYALVFAVVLMIARKK